MARLSTMPGSTPGRLSTLFNSIVNPKRDYVSSNTPADELLKMFMDMPEGARRSASYSKSGTTTQDPGYGWPDLPPEFAEVFSQVPQAKARGELNEQTLKDYMEAMNVYNEGGKAERILSLISGLATTGGYIADRTSGDPERRASAGGPGGDLDHGLQGAFGLPNVLNQKRRDKMTSAMGWADTQRGLRGESIGAMSTAKHKDNYWNYMFRTAGAKAGQERARIGGSTQREKLQDIKWKQAEKFFENMYRSNIGPGKAFPTEDDALLHMKENYGLQFGKLMSGGIWKTPFETPGETYTDWESQIEARVDKRFGQRRKDAGSDPEELEKIDYEEDQYRRLLWERRLRYHNKDVDSSMLDDLFPPAEPGDEVTAEEEGRGFFDVAGDIAGGAWEAGKGGGGLLDIGKGALRGAFGQEEGLDADTAGVLRGVSGEQRVPEGEIVDEDSRGWVVRDAEGNETYVRKSRPGEEKKAEDESSKIDLTTFMELIGLAD